MKTRRGSMLLEIAIATIMLGTLLAVSLQSLGWIARERKSADRRAVALLEAGNVLDRLTRLSWNDLTQSTVATTELSLEANAILPESKLVVTLSEVPGNPPAKRLSVRIDWLGDHGQREGPVQLTAWAFP